MKKLIIFLLLFSTLLLADEKYEIVVEGKAIPFSFDIKRNVIVIEGEYLKQFPALNLAQLISFVANMNFICRGIFQADPQILGFNQEQVVIMINGMPVNNSQTGHHNFSLPFEISQIERIEILRGGFSSLYGSSGSGGIINIIPANNTSFKMGIGSFNSYDASLNLSMGNFNIATGMKATDGYTEGLDGKKYFLQGGTQFRIGKCVLDIWGGWLHSKFGAANFYAPFPSFEELERVIGILKWHLPLKNSMSFDLKFTSQFSEDNYTLIRDNPDYYANNHKTVQNLLELGIGRYQKNLSFTLGFSGFIDSINSTGIREGKSTIALGRHNRNLHSVFGEMSSSNEKIFMNSGFRYTLGNYENLSGHMLLGFLLSDNVKMISTAYRSFRIPTYTELYYNDPFHYSNPNLKPEVIWGYDISIEYAPKKYQFGLRLFNNNSSNLIDWKSDVKKEIWISENINKGKYYGIDLKFSLTLHDSLFKALYTLQKADFDENPTLKPLKYHYYFPEQNFSLLLKKPLKFISTYTALKIEKEKRTNKTRVYLNTKIGKKFGKAYIFFEIHNLFNNRVEKIPGLLDPPRVFYTGISFNKM